MVKSIWAVGLLTAVTSPEPNAPAWSNRVAAPTAIPSLAQWESACADPFVLR